MADRELLKFAAKAIGWEKPRVDEDFWLWNGNNAVGCWNPLEDDGDALRLMVRLKIHITFGEDYMVAIKHHQYPEQAGSDLGAATRRAIVRAAAEIGKAM